MRCIASVLLLFAATVSLHAQHRGPDYGAIPSGCKIDNESATNDCARGGITVTWTDRLNKQHTVTAQNRVTTTVRFPIPAGGTWNWYQVQEPQQQRTGFNQNVTWVEATFIKDGNTVKIRSVGYFAPGEQASEGLLGAIRDRVTDVSKIVGAGARTIEEATRIAGAAGMLKTPQKK